jgi:predicted nucleotide-binding protein
MHDDMSSKVREKLSEINLKIESEKRIPNDTGVALKLRDGRIVNIYDNGRVYVQGKNPLLVRELQETLDRSSRDRDFDGVSVRNVFVVYGHDERARTELENMLRRWNLEPLILDQLPSKGKTIIEKIEHYRHECAFGVILATPDDEGHAAGRSDERAYRARQNVVLELGMLLALLGRSRVAVLMKNAAEMERPSDIQGLIYFPFIDSVDEVKLGLAKEMNSQGLRIDLNRL